MHLNAGVNAVNEKGGYVWKNKSKLIEGKLLISQAAFVNILIGFCV